MSRRRRYTQSTAFLWALLAVFGGLTALLILPYVQYVLLAGLLGYVLYPVSERLSARLGRTVGAAVAVALAFVAVVVPMTFIAVVAVDQARTVLSGVTGSALVEASDAVLVRLGLGMDTADVLDMVVEAARAGSQGLVGNVYSLAGSLTQFAIGAVVFLFLFYYLLRDGHRLVRWARSVTPLPPAEVDALLVRLDRLLWASVVGTVIVATVQAVLTGVALAALGFSNVVFWTLVTFVLSLLPVIGASVVWLPASGYLALVNRPADAAILFVAGAVVISGSDNLIRPLVVQRSAQLNTGLVVVGLFGGLAVFGFLGLFVGPVVVGLAKYLVEVLADRHGVNSHPEP